MSDWPSNSGSEGWHTVGGTGEPAYQNSFTAASRPLQFTRTSSGMVLVRGLIQGHTGGAAGDVIFTLPVGYRPGIVMAFVCECNQGDSSPRSVRVFTDGTVHAGDNNAFGTADVVDLCSLQFLAEG